MNIQYDNATKKQHEYIEQRIERDIARRTNQLVEDLILPQYGENPEVELHNDQVPVCSECGEFYEVNGEEAQQNCRCHLREDEDPQWVDRNEIDDLEPVEIFQWFLLSDDWIADKLRDMGEPILEAYDCKWWGRTCCGQSISQDPTWWRIYQDSLPKGG
jgi:hypothetical protein